MRTMNPLPCHRVALGASLALVAIASAAAQRSPARPAAKSASRPWQPVPPAAFSPSVRRLPPDSLWKRVWAVGADPKTEELFIEPRQLAVSGDLVGVLDLGTREFRALDSKTGATRYLRKPTGDGPGEFRKPAVLAASPTGFALVDHANARVSLFDRTGRFRWSTTARDVFTVNGLCVSAGATGTRVLSTHTRRDSSIVVLDSTGRVLAVRSVPWQQLVRGAVGFSYSHFTSNTVGDQCVVAPIFGSEWAVVSTSAAPRRFALLEPGPQPVVTVTSTVLERSMSKVVQSQNQQSETPHASRGALLLGDTAIVYAAVTATSPRRWLDYYRASTGEYLYSRKLPFIAIALTVGPDGTFYATSIGEARSVVVALRPSVK